MGFFTSTEDTYNDIYIENAHRYEDEYGINLITLEAVQFGQEVFGDMVRYDIQEQMALSEGTEVIHEGIIGDIWEKVKAFFKKAWNKIKLFFKGLYAKILARMTSDNKAFYNKYHKDVDANTDALNMEVKYKEVKDLPDIGALKIDFTATNANIKNFFGMSRLDADFSNDEAKDKIFAKVIKDTTTKGTSTSNLSSFSDFKNGLKEATIGDENEVKFSTIKKEIEDILKTGDQVVKDAQKAESDALKKIKEAEKLFKDNRTTYSTTKGTSIDKKSDGKQSIGPLKAASFLITIITTMTSAIVDIIKFRNSQARKIYARAVSYKESYEYDYELAFTEADSLV